MKTTEISFVIPAMDEERSVERLYLEICDQMKKLRRSFEIIFVDDGSKDQTFSVFKKIRGKDKRVKVIKHRGNWGKSIALQNGFNEATGEIVFTMDADLQDNPKEILRFLNKLEEGFDLVSGWKKKRHDPLSKKIA